MKIDSKFELVPPHIHQWNAADRDIRTFKNNLISGLATCDPEFPIVEWDRLVKKLDISWFGRIVRSAGPRLLLFSNNLRTSNKKSNCVRYSKIYTEVYNYP